MNSGPKILIIEDEPRMRKNMATVLKMEGYEVVTAENGEVGVESAKRELPALVLCDVMMPKLDGYEVLAALRAEETTARIPFIFLTAKGEKADLRAGMNLGADDYLTKPADIDDLLAAITTRLARRDEIASGSGAPNFDSPQPLIDKLGLTPREAEVLLWVAQGKANADIATILTTTESTVKKHLEHVFEKLGVENRGAASLRAIEALSAG
ncbi:MAG: response regulator transcription factor [Chthoniobacteraceae bacterium]